MFVADEEDVLECLGRRINFGRIIHGFNQDVRGWLGPRDLTVLSEDQTQIDWILSVSGNNNKIVGYDPLEYCL